jgi:hypothetical protein
VKLEKGRGKRIEYICISRIGSAGRFVRRRVWRVPWFGFDIVRPPRLWHSLLSEAPPENAQQKVRINSPQSSSFVRPWLYIFVFISSAAGFLAIMWSIE